MEHRLTKPTHPWTNDQVELLNRTLADRARNSQRRMVQATGVLRITVAKLVTGA